jgi:hypothetical protein
VTVGWRTVGSRAVLRATRGRECCGTRPPNALCFMSHPELSRAVAAGSARGFATPRARVFATPSTPPWSVPVVSEKPGDRYAEYVGDGPELVHGQCGLAVLDALQRAAAHACGVRGVVLRQISPESQNANAITEFPAAAQCSVVGGINLGHPAHTGWILECCMQRRSVNL